MVDFELRSEFLFYYPLSLHYIVHHWLASIEYSSFMPLFSPRHNKWLKKLWQVDLISNIRYIYPCLMSFITNGTSNLMLSLTQTLSLVWVDDVPWCSVRMSNLLSAKYIKNRDSDWVDVYRYMMASPAYTRRNPLGKTTFHLLYSNVVKHTVVVLKMVLQLKMALKHPNLTSFTCIPK